MLVSFYLKYISRGSFTKYNRFIIVEKNSLYPATSIEFPIDIELHQKSSIGQFNMVKVTEFQFQLQI